MMKRKARAKVAPKEAQALEVIDVPTTQSVNKFEKKIDLSLAIKLRITDRLTYAQIAERFDCTPEAVRLALSRFTCITDNPEQLEAYRANKLGLFENLEQALLEALFSKVMSGSGSVSDLAKGMDTISKHVRLLQGASTANIGLLVSTLGAVHKDVDAALAPVATVSDDEGLALKAHAPVEAL